MRTKLLLTAFALSALFASCAKEELPTVKVETSERAVVENVTFNFSDNAATRLTYGADYVWEAGDQLGACLMDVITPAYSTSNVWSERFNLVDYIQTNYKFTRDAEGNWTTEAKLCEGNYFVAYPYNMNRGLREAYEFECADQTLEGTDTPSLKKAFANNTSFVGYARIAASNNTSESVNIYMEPVFESNGFVLKNTGSQTYTIEKIVLTGNQVSAYAVVDPTGFENNVENGYYNITDDNVEEVLKYTNTGRIDVALKGGNTVAPDASINVIVMSGTSETLNEGDAVLEIHTNKGLIRGVDLSVKQTANNGELGKGAVVNVLTDKALAKLGKADKVVVTFDDTSLDIPDEMDIYSSDELYRFIKWNAAVNNIAVKANLKADVELTAEMYDILSTSYVEKGSSLTINGAGNQYAVTIEADVEEDAMDLVAFEAVNVVVEGTQSITKPFSQKVIVEKGATFNVAACMIETGIENYGTVNVNIAYKKNQGNAYYTITKLANYGTVTVGGYELHTAMFNYGIVNVNSTLDASGVNYGTLNNNGVLDGSLVNDEYKKNVQNPTINNYGKILNVTNNNVIVMMAKEARVNAADGNGEIDNTIQSDYIATNVDNTVFVKVANLKASELDEIVLNADADKAYISGTLTIDQKEGEKQVVVNKVKEIETAGNLTITGKGKVTFGECQTFTVKSNTETIIDNGSTLSLNGGKLIANGLLTIKNNGTVVCGIYSGNIEVYGTLKKSGTVVVSNVQDLNYSLASGDNVVLKGNIDAQGTTWTPVGTEEAPFTGTLNGNGYKISNLTISGENNVAFIAFAEDGATIKNLTLENVNINSGRNAGGLICEAKGLTLENIKVSGTINAENYAAGLVTFPDDVRIINCENTANITAKYSAGIVAWVEGSANINNVTNSGKIVADNAAAGIANRFNGNIKNAVNNGEIIAKGKEPASGIVAVMTAQSTFEYCFNYGNVTTTEDNANASAAGILGQTPSGKATLNYCANYGNITAEKSYAAGIAYSLYGNIDANYCYNSGNINGDDGGGAIAPKAQYGTGDTAKYCLNAGTITSANGKTYQGSNNNTSSYYYNGSDLKDVKTDNPVNAQNALQVLNGGNDTQFFTMSNDGKISVVR